MHVCVRVSVFLCACAWCVCVCVNAKLLLMFFYIVVVALLRYLSTQDIKFSVALWFGRRPRFQIQISKLQKHSLSITVIASISLRSLPLKFLFSFAGKWVVRTTLSFEAKLIITTIVDLHY